MFPFCLGEPEENTNPVKFSEMADLSIFPTDRRCATCTLCLKFALCWRTRTGPPPRFDTAKRTDFLVSGWEYGGSLFLSSFRNRSMGNWATRSVLVSPLSKPRRRRWSDRNWPHWLWLNHDVKAREKGLIGCWELDRWRKHKIDTFHTNWSQTRTENYRRTQLLHFPGLWWQNFPLFQRENCWENYRRRNLGNLKSKCLPTRKIRRCWCVGASSGQLAGVRVKYVRLLSTRRALRQARGRQTQWPFVTAYCTRSCARAPSLIRFSQKSINKRAHKGRRGCVFRKGSGRRGVVGRVHAKGASMHTLKLAIAWGRFQTKWSIGSAIRLAGFATGTCVLPPADGRWFWRESDWHF